MLNEKLKEKLLQLYARVSSGDLSGGGDVSKQMFLSTVDVILSEEKRELEIKIAAQEQHLLVLKLEIEKANGKKGK